MTHTAESPFSFIGCSELQESIAHQADDEKELAELIEEVPLDSIHFHTHSYFLRHGLIEGTYPNDFAQWVVMQIGDHVLGERLAVIDPFDYPDLENLREEIISHAIVVSIVKSSDVKFIKDGVFVPECILIEHRSDLARIVHEMFIAGGDESGAQSFQTALVWIDGADAIG